MTAQDHAFDPSATEAPVTTGGTHLTPHPIITASLVTPLQTGTLEEIPTGIPHTSTGAPHPATHHTRATPDTAALIAVNLAPGTPGALPIDHTQRRYQSHTHGEKPSIDPSTTRRSLFRTH